MRRKVIQVAGSTQLVSLPRSWSKRLAIKRGQELNVEEDGNRVIISSDGESLIERTELDISNLNGMVARYIYALYKKGVDEIKITFSDPSQVSEVQKIIGKDTVGYELLEQGENYCVVKYVSGGLEEFDSILRRTFLLLMSMIEESAVAIRNNQLDRLKSICLLEETNNRFTTICRRDLNKNGHRGYKKVGPIYYIIEEMEKIADQYKYIYRYLTRRIDRKIKVGKEAMELFDRTNLFFRTFYELFYKFDTNKMIEMKKVRSILVEKGYDLIECSKSPGDRVIAHHCLTVTGQVFGMLSPYIVHEFSTQR